MRKQFSPRMDKRKLTVSEIRQLEIEGTLYTYLPIDVAIKYAPKINSGFFVPLNEKKRVRIEFGEDNLKEKLQDYKDKGLENILFAEEDYQLFLKGIKKGLIGFFVRDSEVSQSLSLEQILFLVKKASIYIGIEEPVCNAGEEQVHKFIAWIKTSSHLTPHFRSFLKDNQDQFIINVFSSYLGLALAQALNWPPHIAEKITQATLLGDILLGEKDYFSYIAANGDRKKWTKMFSNHPVEAAKLLKKHHANSVSREVVRAVEQHQELPDGSGFPKGLKGLSIDQLSAILIVSRTFTDALVESDFSYDDREKFVKDLLDERFDYNNFKNPTKALMAVMGLSKSEESPEGTSENLEE